MQNQAPPIGQYSNGTWANINSPQVAHNSTLPNNLNVRYLTNIKI